MIPHKQLSLADIFEDCQNFFEEDKPQFLALLEQHIDIDEIIPAIFIAIFMHQRAAPVNTLYTPLLGL